MEGDEPLLHFFARIQLGVFVWHLPKEAGDEELRLCYLNSTAEALIKMKAAAAVNKKIDQLFPLSRRSTVPEIIKESLENNQVQVLQEVGIITPGTGTTGYYKLHLMPLKERHILVAVEDISERKRAENALLESEAKFEAIFRYNPLPTSVTRLQGSCITEVNEGWSLLTGWERHQVVGKSIDELGFLQPEIRWGIREDFLAKGYIKNKELDLRCKDGSYKQVLLSAVPIRLGKVDHIINLFLDITERKKVDAELAARQEMLEKLAEQVPGVVYQFKLYPNGKSCFPYASPGIYDIYGLQPEDVVEDATPVFARLHPDDLTRVTQDIFESAENLTLFQCDYRVILPGKGVEWRQCNAKPQRLPDGSTLWYGMITNTTDQVLSLDKIRKLLADQEEQNKRMQNFTYIISHNLRSHTANMQGLFNLMAIEYPEIHKHPYVEMLQQAANNLNTTIQNLNDVLTTKFENQNDWQRLNIHETVGAAIVSVGNLASKSEVVLHNEVAPQLEARVIPAYLESIVLNMLTNAIKFRNPAVESFVKIYSEAQEKGFVLCFEDNGLGIDLTRHRHSLFGLFKTFHRHADSRGLGLYLTKSQIETLGGTIEVDSEVNKGTIFKIYLPYAVD